MARAQGANTKMAGGWEAEYGTPPVTGFTALPFVSSTLGAEQPLIASDLLGFGREPQEPSLDVVTNDGDVVVPVDLRNFGFWLKGLLGAPVTTNASSVYTHTYKSGAPVLPSMSIEQGNPEVPSFGMNFGGMVNTMAINLQTSGLLNATMSLICQGETRATATAAGSPTILPVTRFSQFMGQVTKAGTQLAEVVSATLNFTNNLEKDQVIRPDGQIGGADPGMIAATGTIVTRFADTTLLDEATSGSVIALGIGWQIDVTKSLLFTLPAVRLPKPKLSITGPTGIQVTFNYQAQFDQTSGCTMQAALVNDVAAYS